MDKQWSDPQGQQRRQRKTKRDLLSRPAEAALLGLALEVVKEERNVVVGKPDANSERAKRGYGDEPSIENLLFGS